MTACDVGRRVFMDEDPCAVDPARHVLRFHDDDGSIATDGFGEATPLTFCDEHMAWLIVRDMVGGPMIDMDEQLAEAVAKVREQCAPLCEAGRAIRADVMPGWLLPCPARATEVVQVLGLGTEPVPIGLCEHHAGVLDAIGATTTQRPDLN